MSIGADKLYPKGHTVEKAIVLLVALTMIVLGARGTYAAVWNQFFPNEPITTGANATTPSSTGPFIVPAQPNTVANPSSQAPTVTPNVRTSTGQKVTVVTGGGAYPVESIGTSNQAVLSTGTAPSWWPSWLPVPAWLLSGQGQTGQIVKNPFAP